MRCCDHDYNKIAAQTATSLTFTAVAEQHRYFVELSYDGTLYHGWQVQPNAVTVQELLDKALSTLLRHPVETTGCGRTDTGVHAKEFFAHFDKETMDHGSSSIDKRSLNALLPPSIAIKSILEVAPDAHARFDATIRSYDYYIHFDKDPFKDGYSWLLRDQPDITLMNQAAEIIMEYKDFSCFSKSNTQVKTNNCTIVNARWDLTDGGIVFHISADRFLRNMVRAIVGTLLMVGRGQISPEDVRGIINSKNRSNAGTSVPACGLYLSRVKYPYING